MNLLPSSHTLGIELGVQEGVPPGFRTGKPFAASNPIQPYQLFLLTLNGSVSILGRDTVAFWSVCGTPAPDSYPSPSFKILHHHIDILYGISRHSFALL